MPGSSPGMTSQHFQTAKSSLRGAKRRSNPSHRAKKKWIASRSLSSGAHSRDPLARNGDPRRHALNPSARRPCESRDPYAALYRFFWRAVRDLSFQRTPVVMGPCFRRDDVRGLDLSNPIRLCPRGAMRPRRCIYFSAQERAWGMPGARCTRSLVCTCSGRKHTSNNEYTGITRHSRTQWF